MALPNELKDAPVMDMPQQRAIREHVNQFDKSTIFSIYPLPVVDNNKVTIQPNKFRVPGGTIDKPGRLVVGGASYWILKSPEEPLIEIPIPSIQLAHSIVTDNIVSRIGASPGEAVPGLFYVPGDITVVELKSKYAHLITEAAEKQTNWYKTLIYLADALWATTQGNPRAIDDSMKLAARELNQDRDWLKGQQQINMVACVACGNRRNPQFPICPHCKAIVDKDKAKELGLVFAT